MTDSQDESTMSSAEYATASEDKDAAAAAAAAAPGAARAGWYEMEFINRSSLAGWESYTGTMAKRNCTKTFSATMYDNQKTKSNFAQWVSSCLTAHQHNIGHSVPW